MRDFQKPGRSAVLATSGLCATSHPLASQVAIETLKSGGNAVDAAIAAAVLLGLCEPQMTGLGGDCFVLLSKPDGTVRALNGSGRAPAGLQMAPRSPDADPSEPRRDIATVTIPGAVDAFCALSEAEGKLGLDRCLAPAIHYAETGVPVAPRVAFDLAQGTAALKGAAIGAFSDSGTALRQGQLFRAPGQADILRRIAKEGRNGFYTGEVAADLVSSLRALGGSHTEEDFAQTACTWGDPISGSYRGTDLLEHPPNGQGAAAILLANILANFDLAALDPYGADRVHIEAEATKLAYDARNRMIADPDETARLEHLLSLETAAKLAALIDPNSSMGAPEPLTEDVHRETVYLTVVDRDGLAVSLIYSIFSTFGSGFASDRFGVLFHNRGAGFNQIPGHPNEAKGGKRPMHTIIPALLQESGRTTMAFGVMGGAYQACGHARFVSNLVDYGMDPQTAIEAPRSFWEQGVLKLEGTYGPQVAQALEDKGHRVVAPPEAIGGAQAIKIHPSGVLEGASDHRKDGCALGY